MMLAAVFAGSLLLTTSAASSASEFPCGSFRKNQDGSITTTKRVTLQAQKGRLVLGRGATVQAGQSFGGLNPVDVYNRKCSVGI